VGLPRNIPLIDRVVNLMRAYRSSGRLTLLSLA
jgi:hypothetical protein